MTVKPIRYPTRKKISHRRRHQQIKIKPGADPELKKIFMEIGVPKKVPFQPDPFQIEAVAAIAKSDCLVTAPTGAGKTWIALKAIEKTYGGKKRSWYACPLKALSNSKYLEFSKRFGSKNVGILTGDRKNNPDASIIVGTTEILRNQLYDAMHRGESLDCDLVVLDEAHFLGDAERGVVWEEIMIYLPSRIRLLMLSATIGNASQIASWLASIRKMPCALIAETSRPVPLSPIFFHPSGTLTPFFSLKESNKKQRVHKKVRNYLSIKRPPFLSAPRTLPPFGDIIRVFRKYRLLPAIFFFKIKG
jgi:superfamily II RNA helicase